MNIYDYIVVGSGCSGAMAAQTLLEHDKKVVMVDAGVSSEVPSSLVPKGDFLSLRRTDPNQYKYFLGENIEGVTWGDVGKGAQVTPVRKHMLTHVDSHIPIRSKTFSPLESLGYGGLGIGWGVQCWEYSPADMSAAGLDEQKMLAAYETVSRRIGVSGSRDEAASYTLGALKTVQPSPHMDRNHEAIYKKYVARRTYFDEQGLHMGRTPLALLTKPMPGRKPYQYRDLDFYTDSDKSAWRPWMTVDALKQHANFTYIGGYLVRSFQEKGDYVEVTCLDLYTNQPQVFKARQLVLASGALGSARIALRSLAPSAKTQVPLLCNPYTYIPCIQPAMLGKGIEERKMGFAQLSVFLDESGLDDDSSVASLYSYQSLMMFRVIRQIPYLSYKDAKAILQYLLSGLVIMGVHHPDATTDSKYLQLTKDASSPTGDRLEAHYQLSEDELREHNRREKKILSAMRKTGLLAITRLNPGYGSSVHYAGTLPFSKEEKPLSLAPDGRLHGTKRVYVADSSGFNHLPARGLTFSLLANAHIIAEGVATHAK